ncbi:MAG: putative transport system permease protein [Acidobacteriota bacterium]|jgi:putative ABC transport system permease protein|nr:putative transport system permease protein [Acidobacteriota bacterium]
MDNLIASNIRQRPIRSLVSVIGVALGVALVMLFTGLARGMSNDLLRRSQNLRAEIIFSRPGTMDNLTSSTTNLSTKYVERLQAIDGVESAVPVIVYFFQGKGGFGFEQIEGADWPALAKMNNLQIEEGGRPPQAADEIVIDQTKARNDNLAVGSSVTPFGDKPFHVAGIYSPESGARVKMPLHTMQELLETSDKCTYILVKAKDGVDEKTLAERIDADSRTKGNKIQFTRDVFTSIEKKIPYLGIFLKVLVGLSAVVSALVVMLAMYTTITERTREIGILKAMGASRGYIIGAIEKEAILISAFGLVVGFAVSLLAGILIHRAYGLIFEYGWGWAIAAAAIGLFGGAIGALYPAIRAANLDAVSALSYE